jgi:hypothetical protein
MKKKKLNDAIVSKVFFLNSFLKRREGELPHRDLALVSAYEEWEQSVSDTNQHS